MTITSPVPDVVRPMLRRYEGNPALGPSLAMPPPARVLHANGTRTRRILRLLADAPDGLTTTDFTGLCPPGDPRQRAQSRVGNTLRHLASRGLTVRTPAADEPRYAGGGAGKRQPSDTWRITPAGREALAYAEGAAQREAARRAVLDARESETRERLALLASYRRTTGPGAPRRERVAVAVRLRAAGCSLRQIGDVFGVSREMIRQDLDTIR